MSIKDALEDEIRQAEHLGSPGVLGLIRLARMTADVEHRRALRDAQPEKAAAMRTASLAYGGAVLALHEEIAKPGWFGTRFILALVRQADAATTAAARDYDLSGRIGHLTKPLPVP